jgi:hypothetical protein
MRARAVACRPRSRRFNSHRKICAGRLQKPLKIEQILAPWELSIKYLESAFRRTMPTQPDRLVPINANKKTAEGGLFVAEPFKSVGCCRRAGLERNAYLLTGGIDVMERGAFGVTAPFLQNSRALAGKA